MADELGSDEAPRRDREAARSLVIWPNKRGTTPAEAARGHESKTAEVEEWR